MTQKRTHARGNPRKPSKKKKSSLGDIQDPDPVWTPVDLVICGKGFVKNEKEQYGQYDSLRELINNHYDSGATRVDITIGKNEIEIRGNGHPIEDYDVLRRVFTDIKRENKVITDIDGNSRVMIGEKGRGRFSFVSTANELFIAVTTKDIVAVVRFDGNIIANGKPGKYTKLLTEEFLRFTR